MCGIAGMFGQADASRVGRMLDAQRHRGPDGRNVWVSSDGRFSLGHDRLAIVDIHGGAQPLVNETGSLWAAVNGAIYNHQRLREELAGRHTFRTQSDSEVVLHLFEEEGPEFVRRLDGMFAIAIWGPEMGLFLARDPLGIKPLYYGRDERGSLLFSSEIKALVNEASDVRELPNGSYSVSGSEPVCYDAVPGPVHTLQDEREARLALDQTFTAAVTKRLMADVPVGVFLSGGLDSSLIAAVMRQQMGDRELHSFAVGLEGSADLLHARRIAADLGTIHHERLVTPSELFAALPVVVDALESCDPALVRSSVGTYFVAELASRYVKVVLSGEGADELFAGYHYLSDFTMDGMVLSKELYRITCGLHHSNLQRVDRMTMVHGLEGRVPFLDRQMLSLAFQMDPSLKRREGEGKWILRKVAESYLPASVAWRTKEKFAVGTGIGSILESYAESVVTEAQLQAERSWRGKSFHSKEEWLYWSLFKDRYGRADVLEGMGRSRSLNPGERWVSAL